MKKHILLLHGITLCCLLLIGCSGDNNDKNNNENAVNHTENNVANEGNDGVDGRTMQIPEDVIADADADPIEIKDQMGLAIGETGYAGRYIATGVVAITLNEVETTQAISESETLSGEEFYLVGNFTFENVSDEVVEIIRPDVVKASDESAVLQDEFDNGDLLGVGHGLGGAYVNERNKIPDEGIVNTITLEPGETIDQKISITMRGSTDEYLLVFGFFDGNNKYYQNKVGWTFKADALQ